MSEVPQSKLIKVSPGNTPKQEQPHLSLPEHDNIIFYEEELSKSAHTLEIDGTNRCLLERKLQEPEEEEGSQEEEYEEEAYDEVGEMEKGQRAMVPEQVRLKNKSVVVRANAELFLRQVVPVGYSVGCVVEVERNLLGLASCYRLFLQQPAQFLLSAKKEVFKLYSSFLISRHPSQIHKRTAIYQGRLEANFVGTEYHLFTAKDQI
jgi:hypothetical protein